MIGRPTIMSVAQTLDDVLQCPAMKTYIHARLGAEERATLEQLKAVTGRSESELVRQGLQLLAAAELQRPSAAALAGRSVGRFAGGPRDLSVNPSHLAGFGE
jgi:hypothetical protein